MSITQNEEYVKEFREVLNRMRDDKDLFQLLDLIVSFVIDSDLDEYELTPKMNEFVNEH